MFEMTMSPWEHILRAGAIYLFLFLLLRFVGKKHIGDLAPFDLVVLLILSETVQNAMVGDDNSLLGGMISAGTLILLAYGMGYVCWMNKKIERVLQGRAQILVRHGRRNREVMAQQQVSISELLEAMRQEGCTNIADVQTAVLENDGRISIIRRREN